MQRISRLHCNTFCMAADKRGPKLTPEQRELRNAQILQLFIAGKSEMEIAKAVDTDRSLINRLLKDCLKETAEHRELLNNQALSVYVTRLETLIEAAWVKVDEGDLKAIEVARRLLEQQAKLYGLAGSGGPTRATGAIPPLSDQQLEDPDEPEDELASYRQRHRGGSS
jgi:hypothetical protein